MTKQVRESLLMPTNKRRRKHGTRQRGACQEQPETRRIMEHDTRRGYSHWCEGPGRDRSIYLGTHMMTVQDKEVLYHIPVYTTAAEVWELCCTAEGLHLT